MAHVMVGGGGAVRTEREEHGQEKAMGGNQWEDSVWGGGGLWCVEEEPEGDLGGNN